MDLAQGNSMEAAKPRRCFLRYGLRTFLAVLTCLGVLLGRYAHQVHMQKAAVEWVERNGGFVLHDHEVARIKTEPPGPDWLRRLIGIEWFASVNIAVLVGDRISEVSQLADLSSLKTLSIESTQVRDLTPLIKLRSLETLNLHTTEVSDLSPLAKLKSLETLQLKGMQVSDFSPLIHLKSLRRLNLDNTRTSDKSLEALRKALPNLEVRR